MKSPTVHLFGVLHFDRPEKVTTELDRFAGEMDAIFIEAPDETLDWRAFATCLLRTPVFFFGLAFIFAVYTPLYVLLNQEVETTEAIAAQRVSSAHDIPIHNVDHHPMSIMIHGDWGWPLANWAILATMAWYLRDAMAVAAVLVVVSWTAVTAVRWVDRRLWLVTGIPLTWGLLGAAYWVGLLSLRPLVAVTLVYVLTTAITLDHRDEYMLERTGQIARDRGYADACLITGRAHVSGMVEAAPRVGVDVGRAHDSKLLTAGGETVEDPDPGIWGRHALPQLGTEREVLGRRVAAGVIDLVVVAALAIVLGAFTGYVAGVVPGDETVWQDALLGVVTAPLLYFPLLESLYGQTVGKRLLGLAVVGADGDLCTNRQAWIRTLLRPVDAVLGLPAMLASERRQRIGDLVAGTVVVRAETGVLGSETTPATPTQVDSDRQ